MGGKQEEGSYRGREGGGIGGEGTGTEESRRTAGGLAEGSKGWKMQKEKRWGGRARGEWQGMVPLSFRWFT